jgi:hypothetical protein
MHSHLSSWFLLVEVSSIVSSVISFCSLAFAHVLVDCRACEFEVVMLLHDLS